MKTILKIIEEVVLKKTIPLAIHEAQYVGVSFSYGKYGQASI